MKAPKMNSSLRCDSYHKWLTYAQIVRQDGCRPQSCYKSMSMTFRFLNAA